eukprot:1137470-Pelagomonas_calceolata.AAC.8
MLEIACSKASIADLLEGCFSLNICLQACNPKNDKIAACLRYIIASGIACISVAQDNNEEMRLHLQASPVLSSMSVPLLLTPP